MPSMQGPPTTPLSSSADAADGPRDWLGYSRYAQALWARVVHQFELDAQARSQAAAAESAGQGATRHSPPTGDPLVVGVYGEWGVGKSRLLELLYEKAAEQNAADCAQRARDPQAYAAGPALRLTVPVWFHPWKYEHEPHLAVPLLMHLTEALQASLEDAKRLDERARQWLVGQGEAGAQALERVSAAAQMFRQAAGVVQQVAGNDLVKTTAALAAGYFGLGPAAERTLDWVRRTASQFAGVQGEDGRGGKGESAGKKEPAPSGLARIFGKAGRQLAQATPEASVDGRYYYSVHRYLSELSRVTPERASAALGLSLAHEVRLNFVVFIDDLDRCLPEKAVDVLELIKTVMNVDSFAFVIALDDEVIERGISYRYRDYRFGNAKPEMPITGFEYLEKIVHLPFRLPPLTREWALNFMRQLDERLLGQRGAHALDSLWFAPAPAGGLGPPTRLTELLLDSFDTHIPRKLGRTLELTHQLRLLMDGSGQALRATAATASPAPADELDACVLVFCIVLQLFAPEIFRLLRRRPEIFRHWMSAYLPQEDRQPVFAWDKGSGAQQPLEIGIPDTNLYRWAALGSQAGRPKPGTASAPPAASDAPARRRARLRERAPTSELRAEWGPYLGAAVETDTDRYTIEQLRLPLAVSLAGFRDMQRHAFSPLRLGAAMAHATGWPGATVPSLQRYLNLFGEQLHAAAASVAAERPPWAPVPPPPPVPAPPATAAPIPAPGPAPAPPSTPAAVGPSSEAGQVAAEVLRPNAPVRRVDPRQVLEIATASDAVTRASLVERLNLQPGERIEPGVIEHLAEGLQVSPTPRHLFDALAALAPFTDPQALSAVPDRWRPLRSIGWPAPASGTPGENEAAGLLSLARPTATLARHGLLDLLGMKDEVRNLRSRLDALVEGADLATPLPMRAEAADLLGSLGDERFHFDPVRWQLPSSRARLIDDEDGRPRQSSQGEEPVRGFVRVVPGEFSVGEIGWSDNPKRIMSLASPVYFGRTLVTVAQYRAFIAAGGYEDETLWSVPGRSWLQGALPSPERLKGSAGVALSGMLREPVDRRQPWRWAEQQACPGRPVQGVSWFEADAYVAWLGRQLSDELRAAGLAGFEVRLPGEYEWERAARSSSASRTDQRHYPWGDDGQAADILANLQGSGLGQPSTVGLFPSSPLGLFDLAGNVWEWTASVHASPGEPDPGPPAAAATQMCVRGGSFRDVSRQARCAARASQPVVWSGVNVGLRAVIGRPLGPPPA